MKKNLLYFIVFLLSVSSSLFSQQNSPFENGFNDGYRETLRDYGLGNDYLGNADSKICNLKNLYLNDVKANEKLYADGYRCGVEQASKLISSLKDIQNNGQQQSDDLSLNDIQNKIDQLSSKLNNGLTPQQEAAVRTQILALEQKRTNVIFTTKIAEEQKISQQKERYNAEQNELEQLKRNQAYKEKQELLNQFKQNQIQSQNRYNQELSNTLSSLSNTMQAIAFQNVKRELDRRRNTTNEFIQYHFDRIDKLTNLYNQIPEKNFSKILNGLYSAHLLASRGYSFVNNHELVTETPCLVKIENNTIKNIYLYSKEKFELPYPKDDPENSIISNGIVKYANYQTLETITLLIVEPYLSNASKEYLLIKDGVSYLTIWTNNKKDDGKIIYVQELDSKGNIVREISTPLIYSKSEKLIDRDKAAKLILNSGNKLLFFGEITETPFGRLPLYPKMSKNDMKELKSGEERIVEIIKYRD